MDWTSQLKGTILFVGQFDDPILQRLLEDGNSVDLIDRTIAYYRTDYTPLELEAKSVLKERFGKRFQPRVHNMQTLPPSNRYDGAVLTPYPKKLSTYVIDCLKAYALISEGCQLVLLVDQLCPTPQSLVLQTFDLLTSGVVPHSATNDRIVFTKLAESLM